MADPTPIPFRGDTGLKRIGRYSIVERIGKGAMGVVYGARDDAMGRDVALKVMMADLEGDPDIRTRFFREAQVAAKLLHRNIVTVFDMGEDDGRLFIVMERLRGLTLGDYLKQKDLTLEAKLDVMTQICDGLSVASAAGVFHRDVKPGNLFVQSDGGLKILDFGIARIASSSMTASGFIVGTPDYMSPEQARGVQVDERSDIFSAGAVFYFMLTGRKPFYAPDLPAVLHKVMLEDPLPLRESEAPAPLGRIVLRALAKDPAARYQRFADLLADLTTFGRRYDAETRGLAAGTRTVWETAQQLAAEAADIGEALGAPAKTVGESPDLTPLSGAPVRRANVELVRAQVDLAHTARARRASDLRHARVNYERGAAAFDGNPAAAVACFEAAMRLVPEAARIRAALERARHDAAAEQSRHERTTALLAETARARDAGRIGEALGLAEEAAALAPREAAARQAVDGLRAAIRRAEEEHAARMQALVTDVRRAMDARDPVAAARHLDAAAAAGVAPDCIHELASAIADLMASIESDNARRHAIAAVLESARNQFHDGQHGEACASLEHFLASTGPADAVAQELSRLRAEQERLDRERRTRAEVDELAIAADCACREGCPAEGLRLAEQALALVPGDESALRVAATARVSLHEIAEREARRARAAAHMKKARQALEAARFSAALRQASKAAALEPEDGAVPVFLVEATRRQEEAARARAADMAAARCARAARPALLTARAAINAGDFVRARWAAENAIALDPASVEARVALVRCAESIPASSDDDTMDINVDDDTASIPVPLEMKLRDRAESYAVTVRQTVDVARERASRMLSRLKASRGQATTEWLMIAGLLTAMAILANKFLPGILRDVHVALVWSIRTIAP